MQPLNFSSLDDPVTRTDIASYRGTSSRARVSDRDAVPLSPSAIWTACSVVFVVLLAAIFLVFSAVFDGLSVRTVILAPIVGLLFAGSIMYFARMPWPRSRRRLWGDRLRTSRFAEANGARYVAIADAPTSPGMIFNVGSERKISDQVTFQRAPRCEVGNLSYRIHLPKGAVVDHQWGYIRVPLERNLPHIVLDSRRNNGIRGEMLPTALMGRGTTELEGDFSKYFTLTCPPGYERDVLYVLTPDLMAILIDEGADLDIEIVDNALFIYRPRPFALATKAEWKRVERIVSTIGARAQRRSQRYGDERVNDRQRDEIASEGRRIPHKAAPLALTLLSLATIGLFYFLLMR